MKSQQRRTEFMLIERNCLTIFTIQNNFDQDSQESGAKLELLNYIKKLRAHIQC